MLVVKLRECQLLTVPVFAVSQGLWGQSPNLSPRPISDNTHKTVLSVESIFNVLSPIFRYLCIVAIDDAIIYLTSTSVGDIFTEIAEAMHLLN